ncbi:MAG: DUF433 domain-containing protein [Cellulomonadaceae bacterium]|jgi:uncharacterized protein (DUF433 family)|nr:DUF433 domain-containing protein [Cellulomonadaceae bacterium]
MAGSIRTPQRITMDPSIRFGKPTVFGTRISVADILGWLAAGMSIAEIVQDYPDLDSDAVYAALEYAASATDSRRIAV